MMTYECGILLGDGPRRCNNVANHEAPFHSWFQVTGLVVNPIRPFPMRTTGRHPKDEDEGIGPDVEDEPVPEEEETDDA